MLTQSKVERLLTDLSARARAETAAIVADEFTGGGLSESERRIAVDILTVLANDAEQQVREALADHVKACAFLPASIALTLACDLDPVALPVLRFSPVLSDCDLVRIVRAGSTAKQLAIAGRERVAELVSDALIDTRKQKVVATVLANVGAALSEATLTVLVDRYRTEAGMQMLLADRPSLPRTVVERLLDCASAEVKARLILHGSEPGDGEAGAESERDRAFARLLAQLAPAEIERLAIDLRARNRLPPILLLRCLCEGHLFFFEAAMAALAGLPVAQARPLLHDRGPLGLPAIYGRSGLPDRLLPAFRAAIDALHELARQGGHADPSLADAAAARLARAYPGLVPGSLDSLLRQLGRPSASLQPPAS